MAVSHNPLVDAIKQGMDSMSCFGMHPTIAVACSGGADSLALLLALHELTQCKNNILSGGRVVALTVNHGLRDMAQADCEFVKSRCDELGIDCHVLYWEHNGISARIQEQARNARYELLSNWCLDNGVLHLCLGHHYDDQIETVIMRKNAGSGLYGLAGMNGVSYYHWGRILRPMLGISKANCETYLRNMGVDWVYDVSNDNTNFQRVSIRQSMTDSRRDDAVLLLDESGKIRHDLDVAVGHLFPDITAYAMGCVVVPIAVLQGTSNDIRHELLVRLISNVGGLNYRIGAKDLTPLSHQLHDYLDNGIEFRGVSVGGCDVFLWCDSVWIIRSWGVVSPLLSSDNKHRFDDKFDVGAMPNDTELSLLGKKGWHDLCQILSIDDKKQIRDKYPMQVIYTLPTLWKKGEILWVMGVFHDEILKIQWRMNRKIAPCPFSIGN